MKPAAFDLVRIDAADEAVTLLAKYGERARVLAGGQSLQAILNMRLAAPDVLLDISRTSDLASVAIRDGHLVVGASVTQAAIERRPELSREVPLLALAFPWISHAQIRSRGTVCGSIAHADPSAELPLVLATLGGEVTLRSRARRRVVKSAAFFTGMLSTAREHDEIVESVRFPLARAGDRFAFREISRRHGDFAIAAFAAARNAVGVRLGVAGVADRPVVRSFQDLSSSAIDAALNDFAWELDAQDDQHASARYRRDLCREIGRQTLASVQ